MSSLTNDLLKLIYSAYACKRTIKKSLKHNVDSPTYALAKFYDEYFTELEKVQTITIGEVEELIQQVDTQRLNNQDAEDFQLLLTNIYAFLEGLKPLVERKLA